MGCKNSKRKIKKRKYFNIYYKEKIVVGPDDINIKVWSSNNALIPPYPKEKPNLNLIIKEQEFKIDLEEFKLKKELDLGIKKGNLT